MSLFSLSFAIFLAVVFIAYFGFPKKYRHYQWVILLVASYAFYIFAGARPTVVFFLLASTVSTWFGALKLGQVNARYKQQLKTCPPEEKKALKRASAKKKRRILTLIAVVNFGILAVVKYSNFFVENVNVLLVRASASPLPVVRFLLPLGISFYTFQSIGYVIDVSRGKTEPDKNLLRYALFVSYFPQIIQGPISRHSDLAHQLYEPHAFDYHRMTFGMQRALWGYFKKLVIADRVALLTDTVFNHYMNYEGITVFLAALLYGVQVYADFSGGMDIISGISEALGIDLIENFKRPFFAKSVAEFWQRWHITLGAWMREYVFYPLAMSKPFSKMAKRLRGPFGPTVAKILPTSLASFIVFLIVGIWHGAAWRYVAYGIYQAVFVSSATLFEPFYAKCRARFKIDTERFIWKVFQALRTLFVVTVGRCIGHALSLSAAFHMLKSAFTKFNFWVLFDGSLFNLGLDRANFRLMLVTILFLFIVDAVQERGVHIRTKISQQSLPVRWAIYYLGIFAIIIFGTYGPGYDASSFIYQGF